MPDLAADQTTLDDPGDLGDDEPISASKTTRLTDDPAIDEFPAWTPDGSTLVYSNLGSEAPDSDGFSATQAIWSVSASGGTPIRLAGEDVGGTMPDVAPDGTIAYLGGQGEVWTMGLDGSVPTPLAIDTGGRNFSPRWSPDGSKLAMRRYVAGARTSDRPELGIEGGLAEQAARAPRVSPTSSPMREALVRRSAPKRSRSTLTARASRPTSEAAIYLYILRIVSTISLDDRERI